VRWGKIMVENNEKGYKKILARFKRATKAVNRSVEMVECSLALVLYERGLISEFIL
jgi:IS1 family transposase